MVSVKAALRRALKISRRLVVEGDKVFVAVSGGKDSAVALYVLRELQRERNFELKALHIDLGLMQTIPIVKALTEMLGVELHITRLKDYGINIPLASKLLRRPPCSICGIIKRYLMNRVPYEMGATKIATGHNADDILLFFLKDLAQGRIDWALKLKPITPSIHPKLLPKIRPLYEVTGEETLAIAESLGLPFIKEKCPLAPIRDDKLETQLKRFIQDIGGKYHSFKIQLVRSISKIPNPNGIGALHECKICGEPTSEEICGFCKIRLKISSQFNPLNLTKI